MAEGVAVDVCEGRHDGCDGLHESLPVHVSVVQALLSVVDGCLSQSAVRVCDADAPSCHGALVSLCREAVSRGIESHGDVCRQFVHPSLAAEEHEAVSVECLVGELVYEAEGEGLPAVESCGAQPFDAVGQSAGCAVISWCQLCRAVVAVACPRFREGKEGGDIGYDALDISLGDFSLVEENDASGIYEPTAKPFYPPHKVLSI